MGRNALTRLLPPTDKRESDIENAMETSSNPRRFWLDDANALERIATAPVSEHVKTVARSLLVDGVAIIRGTISRDLCQRIIADYGRYVDLHRDYVRSNLTETGRDKRLVNFHLWSEPSAQLGTNPRVLNALDFIFDAQTCVYSSLTFKYGIQQPVHRDTPHFATWPSRMFVGVWTALEDVVPSAGPLFYYPGAHRFLLDPAQFMGEAQARIPDAPLRDRLLMALDLYNGEVIRRASAWSEPVLLDLAAGDTVIFHPDMPYGGSQATDPSRTHWSSVFHCSPVDVQVHQHDRFFTHNDTRPPADRYGYLERFGRPVAVSGEVGYM